MSAHSAAKLAQSLLLALAAWLAPGAARAADCDISNAPVIDFGRPGANPTAQVLTAVTLNIHCTGSLLEPRELKVCVGQDASASARAMSRPGFPTPTFAYQLYTDVGNTLLGPYYGGDGQLLKTVITLSGIVFPQGDGAVTVYAATVPGQFGLVAGSYTQALSDMSLTWSANTSVPCSAFDAGETFSQNVQAELLGNCSVTAHDLFFGATTDLTAGNIDAASSIDLTCTAGTAYAVVLDGGAVSGNIAGRRMSLTGGPPGVIAYQLYHDSARSQVWGDGSAGTVLPGVGDGTPKSFPVYGRTPPQATPLAGAYSDVVTATVVY